MDVMLWIVLIAHYSGILCYAYTCLTWKLQHDELQIIFRSKNFFTSVSFYDNDETRRGFCDFNHTCTNIVYDKEERHEVVLTLEVDQIYNIDGEWYCTQGLDKYTSYVSSSGEYTSSTHLEINGSVIHQNNKSFIEVKCASCREPYLNYVEYVLNNHFGDTVSFLSKSKTCTNKNGVCKGSTCSCSPGGNEFTRAFKRDGNNTMTISCSMEFKVGSAEFIKSTYLVYNKKDGFIYPEIKDDTGDDIIRPRTSPKHGTSNIHVGIVIAAVVAVVAFVVMCVLFTVCYLKKKRRQNRNASSKDNEETQQLMPQSTQIVSNTDSPDNVKRCVVIKLCLRELVSVPMRIYVKHFIKGLYEWRVSNTHIDRHQVKKHVQKALKTFPELDLNYAAINQNKDKDIRLMDYRVKNYIDFSKLFLPTELTHYRDFDKKCDIACLLELVIRIKEFPADMKDHAKKLSCYVCTLCKSNHIKPSEYEKAIETMKDFILYLNPSDCNRIAALDLYGRYGLSAIDDGLLEEFTKQRMDCTIEEETQCDVSDFGKRVTRVTLDTMHHWTNDWESKTKAYSQERMTVVEIEERIKKLQDLIKEINEKDSTIKYIRKGIVFVMENCSPQEKNEIQNEFDILNNEILGFENESTARQIVDRLSKVKESELHMNDVTQWCDKIENMCIAAPNPESTDEYLVQQLQLYKNLKKEFTKYGSILTDVENSAETINRALIEKGNESDLRQRYNKVCSQVKERINATNNMLSSRQDYLAEAELVDLPYLPARKATHTKPLIKQTQYTSEPRNLDLFKGTILKEDETSERTHQILQQSIKKESHLTMSEDEKADRFEKMNTEKEDRTNRENDTDRCQFRDLKQKELVQKSSKNRDMTVFNMSDHINNRQKLLLKGEERRMKNAFLKKEWFLKDEEVLPQYLKADTENKVCEPDRFSRQYHRLASRPPGTMEKIKLPFTTTLNQEIVVT